MGFPSWLPLLLGFLTAVGPISTDMYLPAFPALESALGTPSGSAQITLATWFAGLAVGQITQGTLSDRFGRRGPLIFGTILYTLGSAGCALAPSLFWLSTFRAITAIGASASMVIPRAMVRDLTDGLGAARLMSQLMLVMGVAPILAPTLGSAVLGFASWRGIFWFAVAYGVVGCALVALLLPETLPEVRRVKLGLGGLVQRYTGVFRERVFLTHAVMGGAGFFGMFAYIGGSSPVFIEGFGLSTAHYALIFGLCSAGFISASQINPRVLPRFGMFRVIRYASRTYWYATAVLAAIAFSGHATAVMLVPPLMLCMTCMGFVMPNTTVSALSRHAAHAASASALMGTMQFMMGAVSGVVVGLLTDGTPRGMAALMLLGATGAVIVDMFRPRPIVIRHGVAMSPIVGIPACAKLVNGLLRHDTPARYAEAVFGAAGAIPVMLPPMGEAVCEALDRLDGLLVPGSPSNVHPSVYGGGESATPDSHDPARDATSLPLIRSAIARGMPVLAICRGIQELNVALGGTLHQEVHALAGKHDHRGGPGTLEERYGPKHAIRLSGDLARLLGTAEIVVNSLHGQAIDRLAPGLVVEAVAPDGTIEAVRVATAKGFAYGVQWHPEWAYADNPHSMALFGAFGAACRAFAAGLRRAA